MRIFPSHFSTFLLSTLRPANRIPFFSLERLAPFATWRTNAFGAPCCVHQRKWSGLASLFLRRSSPRFIGMIAEGGGSGARITVSILLQRADCRFIVRSSRPSVSDEQEISLYGAPSVPLANLSARHCLRSPVAPFTLRFAYWIHSTSASLLSSKCKLRKIDSLAAPNGKNNDSRVRFDFRFGGSFRFSDLSTIDRLSRNVVLTFESVKLSNSVLFRSHSSSCNCRSSSGERKFDRFEWDTSAKYT